MHFSFKDKKAEANSLKFTLVRIETAFVTKGCLDAFAQLSILRDDGQIIKMNFGGEGKKKFEPNSFAPIHPENKIEETIKQIVTDNVLSKHHLILTNRNVVDRSQKLFLINQAGDSDVILEELTDTLVEAGVIREIKTER